VEINRLDLLSQPGRSKKGRLEMKLMLVERNSKGNVAKDVAAIFESDGGGHSSCMRGKKENETE